MKAPALALLMLSGCLRDGALPDCADNQTLVYSAGDGAWTCGPTLALDDCEDGDLLEVEGDVWSCEPPASVDLSEVDSELTELRADHDALAAQVQPTLLDDTVVNVPRDQSDLVDAMAWLRQHRIAPDALVTVRLASRTHTLPDGVDLGHPDGDRIEIVGDTLAPESVVLTGADSALLSIDSGYKLRLISGVTLRGTGSVAGGLVGAGLQVTEGAMVRLDGVVVETFAVGLSAWEGAFIEAEGLQVASCHRAVEARFGAHIAVPNASITDPEQGSAFGVWATEHGSIRASSAVVHANVSFAASYGGFVYASGADGYAVDKGFLARMGGTMNASDATAYAGRLGFESASGATLHAENARASGGDVGFLSQDGAHLSGSGAEADGVTSHGFTASVGASMSVPGAMVSGTPLFGFEAGQGAYIMASNTEVYTAERPYWASWLGGVTASDANGDVTGGSRYTAYEAHNMGFMSVAGAAPATSNPEPGAESPTNAFIFR
jgi:hypothetical protein